MTDGPFRKDRYCHKLNTSSLSLLLSLLIVVVVTAVSSYVWNAASTFPHIHLRVLHTTETPDLAAVISTDPSDLGLGKTWLS